MKNKKEEKGRLLLRITKRVGETSANNCWGWYHQPKVPASMKKEDVR